MTNPNLQNLPPEMQARLADILTQANALAPSTANNTAVNSVVQTNQVPARAPSLMDHTIALRQEVSQLSQQVFATGQVVEAVGQAVGELYQLFQAQTETTDYSSNYQTQQGVDGDF
jgi:hypothetical protein